MNVFLAPVYGKIAGVGDCAPDPLHIALLRRDDVLTDFTPSDIRRFWSKIAVGGPDDCWPWLDRLDADGYGRFRFNGANRKASRVAWAISNGRDPGAMRVLHRCDSPSCVNPAHLHLGTQGDNIREMFERKRSNRKLTEEDVRAIRLAVAAGGTKASVGRRFGITRENIHWIAVGRAWSHVKEVGY